MSRLSEYSKFDHLDTDDEDEGDDGKGIVTKNAAAAFFSGGDKTQHKQTGGGTKPQEQQLASEPSRMGTMTRKGSEEGRYVFECNGRKIYEWEQSLEEVNIYVDAPPNIPASQFICNILPNRLQLGLRGHDRFFIDEQTYSKVNTANSSWYLDDGVINIVLAKVYKGETWESALLGKDGAGVVDPFTKQQIQKELMIERFQEECPGFDFRGAEFNGEAPDPQTFMGGVKYS